jgi:membrane protease YdiL (CAAX protease family)
MIGFVIDILIDLFLLIFPISMASKALNLKPKKLSDLKPALERLGFKKISVKKFFKQMIPLLAALVLISLTLSIILTLMQLNDLEQVAVAIDKIQQISPLFLAYILIARVTTEEVFFRGFLVNRIGILQSTALFAVLHIFYGSLAEVVGAFILGLILAYGFKKSQNIFPLIGAHLLYNIFALLFIFGVF